MRRKLNISLNTRREWGVKREANQFLSHRIESFFQPGNRTKSTSTSSAPTKKKKKKEKKSFVKYIDSRNSISAISPGYRARQEGGGRDVRYKGTMEEEGRKDERGRGRFEFLDKLPPLFPLYASLPTWNNGRVAWKDVSNFAESKVMRLERERETERDGATEGEGGAGGGYMGRILRCGSGVKSISSTSLPILSPAVFYSVIVGGEAKSGRWREERGIRKARGSEWVRGCKGRSLK